MRRFLALLAVAALGAVVYATAAPGGLQTTPTARQFAALKRQVAGLSSTVKTLKGQVAGLNGAVKTLNGQIAPLKSGLSALQTDESGVKAIATADDAFIHNCLIAAGVAGVSRFGDSASGTFGYQYQDSTGNFLTSALDVDPSTTPGAFFQAVAASCVSSGTGALQQAGVPTERRESRLATASP